MFNNSLTTLLPRSPGECSASVNEYIWRMPLIRQGMYLTNILGICLLCATLYYSLSLLVRLVSHSF